MPLIPLFFDVSDEDVELSPFAGLDGVAAPDADAALVVLAP
jgi:hypothetical protein